MTDLRNPMQYTSNGPDPSLVAERNLRNFIAYGLLYSYLALEEHYGTPDPADLYWLRKNFLDNLENAILVLPTMKENEKQSVQYDGDFIDNGLVLLVDGEEVSLDWRFLRYDKHEDNESVLLFELAITFEISTDADRTLFLYESALHQQSMAKIAVMFQEARNLLDAIP